MAKVALFKAGYTEKASGPKASVSVPNDGRVTFLAIGAGTGRWRAHVAFAEVLDDVVLRRWDAFVTDAEPIATVLLDSNNGMLAGWLVEGEGTFAVGGFADAAEGASGISMSDFGIFSAGSELSLPTPYIERNARASLNGSQVVWRGKDVGWVGESAALSTPPASGSYVGEIIWVANPAVPRGRSRLEWTGTIWAPPAGEMIAGIWRGASPVALVAPGNTSLTVVYQSPIIPDYMLPANIKARICGFMSAKNASGVANCLLAMAISGSVPTVTYQFAYAYPLGTAVTPNSAGIGIGLTPTNPRTPHCGIISVPNARNYFLQSFNAGPLEMASADFPFIAGNNRLYAMSQPSGAADQIQFDGVSVVSEGNL